MRVASTCNMLPIPCDNLNEHMFNCGSTSFISSNGYYGYQPHIHYSQLKNAHQQNNDERLVTTKERVKMDVEVELNNAMETGETRVEHNVQRPVKKRKWEPNGNVHDFKKRRESHDTSFALQPEVHLGKPTHNIPDQKIVMKDPKIITAKEDGDKIFEDMLRETHGVSLYHWLDN